MRTKLNIILGYCHAEVLREMGYSDNNLVFGPPDVVSLTLQRGMYLKYEVIYEKRKRILQGCCDYSLWYGDAKCSVGCDLDLNLVVFERFYASTGETPCLAYMAALHDLRKRAGKKDSTVYGLATDAMAFYFHKIDDQGQVSYHTYCINV